MPPAKVKQYVKRGRVTTRLGNALGKGCTEQLVGAYLHRDPCKGPGVGSFTHRGGASQLFKSWGLSTLAYAASV